MEANDKTKKFFLDLGRKIPFLSKVLFESHKAISSKSHKYFRHGNIVSHKYKVIYIPIPKVASSSMKKYFSKIMSSKIEHPIKVSENYKKFQFIDFPYVRRNKIESYRDYLKFAFVRNPYKRLLSCYKNFIGTKKIRKNFELYGDFYPAMPFKEFVRAISEIPDNLSDGHFRSQHTFITNKKGNLIVDYIGKVENLDKDFKEICDKTGMPYEKLSQENKKSSGKYQEFYDEETKKLVEKRYRKDIELFGYEF